MSLKEYIKQQQKQNVFVEEQRLLEEERQRAIEEEAARVAEEEAARVAEEEAKARKRAEIAAHKKLLLERQEDERLHQKHTQRKEKLTEQKWNNQRNVLLTQINDRRQKDDKLEEIRIIIQTREPSLQELDWAGWLLSDPLNQRLADLDFEEAMAMYKRDNLLAKRRHGGRRDMNYVLAFTGDTPGNTATYPLAVGNEDYATTTFDPQAYNLNNGFTVSFWVRPDELGTHMFALGRRGVNTKERFTFGLQSTSKLYLGVGKQKKTSSNHGMTVGNWYHWVITFAGGTLGALIAYRDGEDINLAADGNGTSTWVDTAQSWPIFFGGRSAYGSYNAGWACALSQIAIFDEVKDADWVTDVYAAGRTGTNFAVDHSGLVGYWRFSEGSGITVTDYSENGNDGTFGAIAGATTAYPTWESGLTA